MLVLSGLLETTNFFWRFKSVKKIFTKNQNLWTNPSSKPVAFAESKGPIMSSSFGPITIEI